MELSRRQVRLFSPLPFLGIVMVRVLDFTYHGLSVRVRARPFLGKHHDGRSAKVTIEMLGPRLRGDAHAYLRCPKLPV